MQDACRDHLVRIVAAPQQMSDLERMQDEGRLVTGAPLPGMAGSSELERIPRDRQLVDEAGELHGSETTAAGALRGRARVERAYDGNIG